MPDPRPSPSDRTSPTDRAIVAALIALTAERRYAAIRVGDLIERARIGRSTFYEHFRGKDDVLLAAMQPVLLVLATAASGRAARSYVRTMVDHLWDRRSTIRALLGSSAASILDRDLAETIASHGSDTDPAGAGPPLFAIGIAAAQLAILRNWLAGRAAASVDDVTDALIACSHLRGIDRCG